MAPPSEKSPASTNSGTQPSNNIRQDSESTTFYSQVDMPRTDAIRNAATSMPSSSAHSANTHFNVPSSANLPNSSPLTVTRNGLPK